MKKKSEKITIISVKYKSYVDSMHALGPIVIILEGFERIAIPRYGSKGLGDGVFEHENETTANEDGIYRMMNFILYSGYGKKNFPYIIDIETKEET